MTGLIAWLAASQLGRWVASVLAALAIIGGLLFRARRQGRSDAMQEFEEADRAESDAIRRRTDPVIRGGVPKYEGLRGRRD